MTLIMAVAYLLGKTATEMQTDTDRPLKSPSLTLQCEEHLISALFF
jgi:hypothetical protein